ncbi:SpoIIE family protein phosphatase [Pseudomaricurvus alkylphenolicus]|uniref:fused response regulator/phosphatase n=1 Tax=Pseudomaricurvus alkylphenolicus TaxID=1306991 RepID=UPI0014225676|nr:fused response regulator/phosphatase [Pseudomaricurvus alkylphenolicus]NIB43162.1 SpoIIE family protein phosphatase [Pseudomaricurvus alkylphenolicus]
MPSGSRKLLIIDDDTIVRQSIVAYLEDSGFDMLEADQGVVGMELFHQHAPDVVLTDLRMPLMDGLQVLDQVHQVSQDTPVIVMSGVGVMGDVVESLRLGASDFLIKPLADMEVLVHAVRKSLERRDLLAENQRYREQLEEANIVLRDHLRALEKDQEAGRQVQQRLLPPTPLVRGNYCLEHSVIPSLFLSGDFVDVAFRSERFLAFYLTDVSGHGASSAFATVWLKHAATEIVHDHDLFVREDRVDKDMNQWLTSVNQQLLESRLGHHMTCLLGVVDVEQNRLHYCIAGHLPLPVIVERGKARFLEGKGRPLGLFPKQSWPQYSVDFPAGSQLLGFSDGILEVMPPEDLLEKEDYLLNMLSNGHSSMAEVCQALHLEELEEAPDDIAILSIVREA